MFFGCISIVYAPLLAIFIFVISKKSQHVILSIGSGFFWLLSIFVTSILWYVIPLRETFLFVVPLSVVIQEGMRYLFYHIYTKAETAFGSSSTSLTSPFVAFESGFAMGFGTAFWYSVIQFTGVAAESIGPATLQASSCPALPLFVVLAIETLIFGLHQICWSLVSFQGYTEKRHRKMAFTLVFHLVASLLTVINSIESAFLCYISLVLQFLFLVFVGFYTIYSVRQVQLLR